ncbi:hypothetical protein [Lacticaseibacillus saniviri]|uniref:hypothetical protein n=1 Tax=Lacticaseibacillus saniviri TaxID=931533 RepID=UPI001EE04418|nr:hypothetical protein [Lacticaseibacillus saniviri]MCG4280874.1 hypothetical protein [Lacticaseibacillus saniviri]
MITKLNTPRGGLKVDLNTANLSVASNDKNLAKARKQFGDDADMNKTPYATPSSKAHNETSSGSIAKAVVGRFTINFKR